MSQLSNLPETPFSISGHTLDIVEIPFQTPVHLPFGTIHTRPSAWLRLSGEVNNIPGIGAAEGTSLPMQIPLYDDFSGNLHSNISSVMGEITGKDLTIAEAHGRIGDANLNGNFATARMTVESGLLDFYARTQGVTVYEALTGEQPGSQMTIPYGKSIAENDYDKILAAGHKAVNNGAQRLKFKLSPTNSKAVIKGIAALQRTFPGSSFMVDANGTFDPEDSSHLDILSAVDELELMMIEEPVSRVGRLRGLDAHDKLKSSLELQTPVALDDAISNKSDALFALEQGLGEILNLKPGRVGSFLDCIEMAVIAKQRNRQIMVGGMFEATPGRTMTLTLAAICLRMGFSIPGDVSLPQERLSGDLITGSRLELDDKHNVIFKPTSGWGYEL